MLLRLLFILIGIFAGNLARNYLTGVYSIIFESLLWSGLIIIIIYNVRIHNEKRKIQTNQPLK